MDGYYEREGYWPCRATLLMAPSSPVNLVVELCSADKTTGIVATEANGAESESEWITRTEVRLA